MLHDATGLPWWGTIVLATVCARSLTLPLSIFTAKATAKMQKLKPLSDQIQARMKAENEKGTAQGKSRALEAQKELGELYKTHNVKPWATIVGALGQMPMWMTFFFTIRDIASRPGSMLGFDTGGMLWFPDLCARDPYLGLPVMAGATFYMMTLASDPGGKQSDSARHMKTFSKGAAIAMPAFTYWMESGVFVYWVTNNVTGVMQSIALKVPAVRAATGMPALPKNATILPPLPFLNNAEAAPQPAAPFVPEVTYAVSQAPQKAPQKQTAKGAAKVPLPKRGRKRKK